MTTIGRNNVKMEWIVTPDSFKVARDGDYRDELKLDRVGLK